MDKFLAFTLAHPLGWAGLMLIVIFLDHLID
ncbi:hypothetical protein FIU96_12030 [Marinobacter sp. THAF39]|nr:hypothetical protein FIV08_12115 [Marinobacter sp. THAF197a]QFT51353.1 hypothetical protein FIU96_12030 [Marinobacter sp. THAF39]